MNKHFPHYWICNACAEEREGKWPEKHSATVAMEKCNYCEGNKQLPNEFIAPWVDYNWPDKKLTQLAKANRD